MTVRYIDTMNLPVSALREHPDNPRTHNLAAIAESRRENGEFRAIVVRADDPEDPASGGTVLAGHGNLQAAIRAGDSEIRCEIIDCDDERARKVVLADNRTGDLGDYDPRLLAELLGDIEDLTGTGYNEDDLEVLLRVSDLNAEEATAFLAGEGEPDDEDDFTPVDKRRDQATLTYTVSEAQLGVIREALSKARDDFDCPTPEALARVCRHYLDT